MALLTCSAALYTLALPPFGVTQLVWVALVPFLIALHELRPRDGALAGLLWGTLAIWGVGHWVPIALAHYYQQPLWFGLTFSLAASVVFAGSYSAGFAGCLCASHNTRPGVVRMVIVASLWVAWELARERLLTGEPWLLLGYGLVPDTTLAQAADIGGVYILSFLVVLVNAAIADAVIWRGEAWPSVSLAAGMLLAAYLYGAVRIRAPLPETPTVPVAIVQGNSDLGSQWLPEFYGEGLAQYLRLSETTRARPPRLLVWPESAVTFFLAREPAYRAQIGRLLDLLGAELIVGGPHYEGNPESPQYFNSAFHVATGGRLGDRYDKSHLLPFAEYFPLRTIEFLRRRFERVRFFTRGGEPTLLRTGIGNVAVAICFEGIFPDLVRTEMSRGADLLVNLSNDTWLGPGPGPEQHLSMVVLRAIENRTWVLRATTSGISAIVDPFGRITSRSRLATAEVLEGTVVPMHVATVYKRFGDAFAYACVVAYLALTAIRWSRSRTSTSP